MFQTEGRGIGLCVGLFLDEQTAREWLNIQLTTPKPYEPVR